MRWRWLTVGLLWLWAQPAGAQNIDWQLPPGFPPPAVPADNPMSAGKVALGARLFREPRLSITGSYSCASCHQSARAYTDGRAQAVGATGELTRHSAMSLTNVAYNASYGWGDNSVQTLEAQMLQPLFNEHPIEMGLKGREPALLRELAGDASYRSAFAAAFPGSAGAVSIDHVIKAIASFERTLISGRSAFDRYVFDDDRQALSAGAKRGMALFYSARGGCAQCHSGLNFAGPLRTREHAESRALFANTGLYNVDGRGAFPATDRGLIEITGRTADMGRMRVPSLRNIALTAPYMHDGSLPSLAAVIEHYVLGGRQSPHGATGGNRVIDRRIRRLDLSTAEQEDVIAFLNCLTDPDFLVLRN